MVFIFLAYGSVVFRGESASFEGMAHHSSILAWEIP